MRDGVSNHQHHHCLLNCSLMRRSKKTSKLRVTGLCAGNSPVTGEFPAQMASNAGNVSILWRHHVAYWPHLQNETLDSTAVSMAAICVLLFYYKSAVVRLGVSIVRRLIYGFISSWLLPLSVLCRCAERHFKWWIFFIISLIHPQTWTVEPLKFGNG